MHSIQSLIESELSVQQIIEVFGHSGVTYVKEPNYNGIASVKLRIDSVSDGGWKGIVVVDGFEIPINGKYGVQYDAQGLIIPAGVSTGEWDFDPRQ